jgi:hypothetical protein
VFVDGTYTVYEPLNDSVLMQDVEEVGVGDVVKGILKVQSENAQRSACALGVCEDVMNAGDGI